MQNEEGTAKPHAGECRRKDEECRRSGSSHLKATPKPPECDPQALLSSANILQPSCNYYATIMHLLCNYYTTLEGVGTAEGRQKVEGRMQNAALSRHKANSHNGMVPLRAGLPNPNAEERTTRRTLIPNGSRSAASQAAFERGKGPAAHQFSLWGWGVGWGASLRARRSFTYAPGPARTE